jgi:hypothetical protein
VEQLGCGHQHFGFVSSHADKKSFIVQSGILQSISHAGFRKSALVKKVALWRIKIFGQQQLPSFCNL